jgi:predicted nucleotidyltransferase
MFTVAQRGRIRDGLVRAASEDERITAAAFVGSAATDREDRWSDIDLALRIRSDLEPEPVAQHWTERMYADHNAVHHLDVWAGPALYRVFLLSNTLQVDLSFWPSRAFAASGPSFRLLFGETNDAPISSMPGWAPGWRGRSKSWSAPATARRNVPAGSETETGGHKPNRKSRDLRGA